MDTDPDMDMDTGMIRRHKQFKKNYNMIWPIGHSAGSRPRQLRPRPRPKAPQQIKNFPSKKRPISLIKRPKIL